MGKLANPFASHAKDPQFEPGWNHFVLATHFACCFKVKWSVDAYLMDTVEAKKSVIALSCQNAFGQIRTGDLSRVRRTD